MRRVNTLLFRFQEHTLKHSDSLCGVEPRRLISIVLVEKSNLLSDTSWSNLQQQRKNEIFAQVVVVIINIWFVCDSRESNDFASLHTWWAAFSDECMTRRHSRTRMHILLCISTSSCWCVCVVWIICDSMCVADGYLPQVLWWARER